MTTHSDNPIYKAPELSLAVLRQVYESNIPLDWEALVQSLTGATWTRRTVAKLIRQLHDDGSISITAPYGGRSNKRRIKQTHKGWYWLAGETPPPLAGMETIVPSSYYLEEADPGEYISPPAAASGWRCEETHLVAGLCTKTQPGHTVHLAKVGDDIVTWLVDV